PGISQANGLITTRGRYVVQKAELLTLFYYYLFQGNYNFFNTNEISYDDVSTEKMTELQEMSAKLHFFGLFGPIGEEGIVPDPWKVPQPEAGITIYEPTSFVTGVRNQLEMDLGLVDFALANLCITAGCEIEEAAARLGYAAWNLDKSVSRQLAEAETRNEIEGEQRRSLQQATSSAADLCRRARTQLLANQPQLPGASGLAQAKQAGAKCRAQLESLLGRL
ncbi:MAG: hypothetical protein VCC19_01660, partial [Myxococcota bacterium]